MSKLKRMLSGRTALALAAWVVYVLAFIPLYRLVGPVVTALAGLPVIVMGWLFGMRVGLLSSLLAFLLNILLMNLVGEAGWDAMVRRALPGSVLLVLIGAVVGRLHDLGEQVEWELTERGRAEEALRGSEEKLRTIFEEVTDMITYVDTHGRILDVNNRVEDLLGYRRDEVIGKNFAKLGVLGLRDLPKLVKLFRDTIREGEATRMVELEIKHKNGNKVCVEVGTRLIKKNGKVEGVVNIFRDMTERKRAEREIEERRTYLEGVLGAAPDAIITLDAHHRVVEWNAGAERLFGYSQEEAAGRNIDDLVTRSDVLEEAVEFTQVVMEGGEVPPVETVRYRKDGSPVDVIVAGSPILVGDEFIGVVAVYTDIAERKRAERERERLLVAEREQRLLAETLAEVTLALTSLTSHEAVLDEILRQVQRIVPYSTANIALLEGDALRVAHWRGYEAFGGEELISSLVQTLDDLTVDLEVIQSRQSLVIPDTGQEPRWVVFDETAWVRSYLVVPICLHDQVLGLLRLDCDTPGKFSAEDGERLQPLANVAAIALENAQLFGEVQRLAITDGLTGTHNRRHFFELAERELNRARRFQHPVSAIMLDIDHFKQVNDTYGHAIGDQVLRVVAERCGESIRDIDILGRYGGEEFAVILPATDLPGAQTMAERLRRSVADAPVPTDKGDLTVTISLGVASNAQGQDDDEEDVAALLNRADAAMYAAKQAGRNRVAVIGR